MRIAATMTSPIRTLDQQISRFEITMESLLAYLEAAPIVLGARGLLPDRVDRSQPGIPIVYRCDGEWIWSEELVQYLARHGIAPPDEFIAHVANRRTPPKTLSAALEHEAVSTLKQPLP